MNYSSFVTLGKGITSSSCTHGQVNSCLYIVRHSHSPCTHTPQQHWINHGSQQHYQESTKCTGPFKKLTVTNQQIVGNNVMLAKCNAVVYTTLTQSVTIAYIATSSLTNPDSKFSSLIWTKKTSPHRANGSRRGIHPSTRPLLFSRC